MTYSRHDKRAAAKIYSDAAKVGWREALNTAPFGVEIVCKEGRLRHGQLELRYDHALKNEFDLFFEPGVFTQAFPEVNDKLVEAVVAAVQPHELPRVLELHAGIGNFSIPLARSGAKLVAVELDKRASVLLGRNARASGLDIEIHAKRDDEVTTELQDKDVVVLDPPRTGARTICEALVQTPVERIVYISCDPATLARDTALLSERYTISSVQGFDMFPQTPHVETLVVFKMNA